MINNFHIYSYTHNSGVIILKSKFYISCAHIFYKLGLIYSDIPLSLSMLSSEPIGSFVIETIVEHNKPDGLYP